jgi:hypothetical protein
MMEGPELPDLASPVVNGSVEATIVTHTPELEVVATKTITPRETSQPPSTPSQSPAIAVPGEQMDQEPEASIGDTMLPWILPIVVIIVLGGGSTVVIWLRRRR